MYIPACRMRAILNYVYVETHCPLQFRFVAFIFILSKAVQDKIFLKLSITLLRRILSGIVVDVFI